MHENPPLIFEIYSKLYLRNTSSQWPFSIRACRFCIVPV